MIHTGFQTLAARYAHLATSSGKPLTVTFSGDGAWTTPERLNLPAFEAGTVLTPHQLSVYSGLLDHEIGHQRFTDFSQLEHCKTPVVKALLNALEDPREEALQIAAYPGSKKYLDAVCYDIDGKVKDGKNPSIFWLIYKEAYILLRNIDTGLITGRLGDKHPKLAELLKDCLPRCRSTRDCRLLAEKLAPELEQEPESEPEPNPEGEEGSARPDKTDGAQPDTDTEPNTGANSADLDQQAEDFLAVSDRSNAIITFAETIKHSNKKLSNCNSPPKQGIILPADTSNDKIFIASEQNRAAYDRTRTAVSSQIIALKKMLSIYLLSRKHKAWSRGLEKGILDRERLHTVAYGETRIYKMLRERKTINTSVQLLLDLSSSMNEELTRSSAIILAEALAGIPHLKLSIAGFTGYSEARYERRSNIGRISSMQITIFKDFDEPYTKVKAKLGAIATYGNTPLGDAYGKGLERILTRSESRRVLWVVTDGEPSFPTGNKSHSDLPLMAQIHAKCQRLGIETLGLGIGQPYFKNYVDCFVLISEIGQLPQALMQSIRNVT